jgi:hypothetical protein
MSKRISILLSLGVALATPLLSPSVQAAEELAPLPIKLPIPTFQGTPPDMELGDLIEKPSNKPRAPFLAPKGCENLALNKKVASSDMAPITGTLDLVTNGDKESTDATFVELHRKTQWVQIDLEKPGKLYAIVVWHAHNAHQVYHDVIVQVADDADFTQNVQTVYNNDHDNSSGLGVGTDKEYFENFEGRLMSAKGIKGRYVRLYSKGSTYSALNRYTEVEVWGIPAE